MRPMSKKKMTVQLAEPFVWPEEVDDYSPYVDHNSLAVTLANNVADGRKTHIWIR